MYTKKNLLFFLTILFFSTSSIFAQLSATSSAAVKVSLKKGLTISNVGGSLDFNEVVLTGVATNPSIAPASGAQFLITGAPNKNVYLTYGDLTFDNSVWQTSNANGTLDDLKFTPDVFETGSTNAFSGAANAMPSGITSAKPLVNDAGVGKLYLWVGGSIDIAADQAGGEYAGTFSITVAY